MRLGPVLVLPDGKHRVAAVEVLGGGTSKGVRRVRLEDGGSVVVYSWEPGEDRWVGAPDAGDEEPFVALPGPQALLTATGLLDGAGVRVPRVLTSDGHVVVVEDVPGPRLADVVETTTAEVFERLGQALGRLRAVGADRCGRPGAPLDVPFPDLVCARARRHLLFAAARDLEVAAVAGDLRAVLGRLQDAVRPRAGYSLVHGELGPEHVIVAPGDEPVLVDVEGLMFADAEWEHAYLRMRLGRRHAVLDPGDLDPARLELYRVALHLSLVAGPLRLADAPGALGAVMRDIAGHHAAQLVAAARPAGAT